MSPVHMSVSYPLVERDMVRSHLIKLADLDKINH